MSFQSFPGASQRGNTAVKLTNKIAREIEPEKSEIIVFDDDVPGFGVRIRKGGSRVWVFQYKAGGRQGRRFTIGKVSAVDVTKARDTAKDMHAKVRLGGDPVGERAQSIVQASETFRSVVDQYLAHQRTQRRPRAYDNCQRHLLKYAKPLHGVALAKVDRRAIAALLTQIGTSAGHTTSNRVRTSMGAFFSWAIRQGLTDTNPALNTNRYDEKSRSRVLSDNEVRAIWNAAPMNSQYGVVLKLLLLTGQRRSEIGDLKWSEIDFAKGVIMLPANRVKNGEPHTIPMARQVRDLLAVQVRTGRDAVFGGGRGSGGRGNGYTKWSEPKRALDKALGIAPWVIHDLRRTAATGMAEKLKVPPHIIEAVLNHTGGAKAGVAGIYNRAVYAPEKAEALRQWADHVTSIVEAEIGDEMPGMPRRAA